ncbi:MAG: 1-(5-phosphoribosyl)-5-((5-phosphoribosylamino)methylideneamino)imidazole-4-carboxamide isomerase [Lysobacter sp.]|nr:1-(5-phosphoribosyl)-5-((5-phosphoribosylamino)methylideneamino)imidazole-4-carboxamide isomerase [Lysobacter sp.]
MSFTIYPAIDVRDGRVVRLRQGDYAQETRYRDDPLALAQALAAQGTRWLHLVDLDAARAGGYTLHALLGAIRQSTGLCVQTGGGVRSETDVEGLLAAGAERVVVGSLAVREPERVARWLRQFGTERLVVALDTRRDDEGRWRLPSHGWTQQGEGTLEQLADGYLAAGLRHLLCTDIDRDGMLAGPNAMLYRVLCARLPGVEVQASGGVRDVPDLDALRAAGCGGAVLGRALLDGALPLREALTC